MGGEASFWKRKKGFVSHLNALVVGTLDRENPRSLPVQKKGNPFKRSPDPPISEGPKGALQWISVDPDVTISL